MKLLDQNIPSSRESIDDKMRKFELGVRFDIQAFRVVIIKYTDGL